MPRKTIWTVRVVNFKGRNELPGVWTEQFRYMGMAKELADYGDRTVVEFYCPHHGHDTAIWARQNAERMMSFGIYAAAAPIWNALTDRPLDEEGSDSSFLTRKWRNRGDYNV